MTRTDARTIIEENARRTLVVRFINLDGIRSIKRGGKRLSPKERRAADRSPQTLQEANAEMKELFG